MIEYLLHGIFFVGVVLAIVCYATMKIGEYIDTMETPKKGGMPWFSTPTRSTQITSVVIMGMYIVSSLLVLSDSMIMRIFGVVGIISTVMVTVTTIVFSFAVMSKIRNNQSCQDKYMKDDGGILWM